MFPPLPRLFLQRKTTPRLCYPIARLDVQESSIMRRSISIAIITLLTTLAPASAQEIMGDVFAGKLINPEVGVWAWYELSDSATGAKFYLRQAIVAQEDVKRKTGYWVETELMPQEGFPSIYKMLLTGPASDPKNIHQLIIKQGQSPPESVPIAEEGLTAAQDNGGARELVGNEKLKLASGEEVETQHYRVGSGPAAAELWLNDTVRPMGIVKMRSAEGELMLQRFGTGGRDGESVINAFSKGLTGQSDNMGNSKVEIRVNGERRDEAAPEAEPPQAPPAEEAPAKPKGKKAKPREKAQ